MTPAKLTKDKGMWRDCSCNDNCEHKIGSNDFYWDSNLKEASEHFLAKYSGGYNLNVCDGDCAKCRQNVSVMSDRSWCISCEFKDSFEALF